MASNESPSRPQGPRGLRDPREWHRDYPNRRIAGVCESVASNLEISVSLVRAFFVLTALIHGAGIVLYVVLWLLLPDVPGESAALDRWIRSVRRVLGDTPPASNGTGSE